MPLHFPKLVSQITVLYLAGQFFVQNLYDIKKIVAFLTG